MPKRLPTESQLLASVDFGIAFLERVRVHGPELLRRRQHDVTDGFPAASLGGAGGGNGGSSPTESAALARPMADPIGDFIDIVLGAVADFDKKAQHGGACLSHVLTAEDEMRGRVVQSRACKVCDRPIDNDPDARAELCGADRKAWQRDRAASSDVLTRDMWIARRRLHRPQPVG